MFDHTELPSHADAADVGAHGPSRLERPADFMLRRNGTPFAILNATPALARNTVAGFRRTAPGVSWSVDRV